MKKEVRRMRDRGAENPRGERGLIMLEASTPLRNMGTMERGHVH